MEQITRGEAGRCVARVGVDLAKRVIQVHTVDAAGRLLSSRALARERFIGWCAQLPAGCVIAMEAGSSAHHWARKLRAMGLDARIVAAHLVTPFRRQGSSGKNDANDAAAICEASSRPGMHFVPVKSVEQQSVLCVHRLREGLKEERTACINRIRGLLAEFGLVVAQSPGALRASLADLLEDAGNEMGTLARLTPATCRLAVARTRRAPGLVRRSDCRARADQRASSQGNRTAGRRADHRLGGCGHRG